MIRLETIILRFLVPQSNIIAYSIFSTGPHGSEEDSAGMATAPQMSWKNN